MFTAADLAGVKPIRAVSGLKGFKASEQPVLASGKVRQVGELVAMCVARHARRSRGHRRSGRARPRGTARGGRHDRRADQPARLRARRMGRQRVPRIPGRRRPFLGEEGRGGHGTPHHTHRAPAHVADGRPRRGVRVEPAARPARDAQRDADAAHQSRGPLGVPRHRPGLDPRDLARRGRRLRLQGHPAARRDLPRMAVPEARPAGALDRGPPRAALGERELPRAPLRHHRLCRREGQAPRHRLRSDRGFRRLLVLSLLRVPRRRAGGFHPARPVQDGPLPLPHLVGGHEQGADPSLPGRRAHRRVLRARADDGRGGARAGDGAARAAPREPRAAGGDAVREHHEASISTAATIPKRCAARRR